MRLLKSPAWYCAAWLTVIVLSLAGSYFNSVLLDIPFHIRQELPFIARWLVWIPLTPLAVALAERMIYSEHKFAGFLLYHFCIYLLLLAIHVFLASGVSRLINYMLSQPASYAIILKKCALTGLFFNFIVYTIIVLIINGDRYYQALQSEKIKTVVLQKQLSDTRLQFLKQQLQPHFLFNAHHSIITLIKMGEKAKAAAMLEKLSELMRVALRDAGGQVVPLNEELDVLKLYVDIQKVRFEDKMQVEYTIDNTTCGALVPCMILQPLVENSIKHCVERFATPSRITVTAASEQGRLALCVKDYAAQATQQGNMKNGTGISNSVERLHTLYGKDATFDIGAHTEDNSFGMTVRITIPLQYATA